MIAELKSREAFSEACKHAVGVRSSIDLAQSVRPLLHVLLHNTPGLRSFESHAEQAANESSV